MARNGMGEDLRLPSKPRNLLTTAQRKLSRLVEGLADTHEPIHITGKRKSAVIVGEELLQVLTNDPFSRHPPFEKLLGGPGGSLLTKDNHPRDLRPRSLKRTGR